MNAQIIIFALVALAGTAALIWRVASCIENRNTNKRKHMAAVVTAQANGAKRHHLIEIGHESEEFFVAGDRIFKDEYDYDEADDM